MRIYDRGCTRSNSNTEHWPFGVVAEGWHLLIYPGENKSPGFQRICPTEAMGKLWFLWGFCPPSTVVAFMCFKYLFVLNCAWLCLIVLICDWLCLIVLVCVCLCLCVLVLFLCAFQCLLRVFLCLFVLIMLLWTFDLQSQEIFRCECGNVLG